MHFGLKKAQGKL